MSGLSIAVVTFAGFLTGSLVEYWVHRAMHRGWILAKAHARHHAANRGKGVIPEFLHYSLGTAPLLAAGFLISVPFGWAWFAGTASYGFFSAYGHQLQHDNPAACFWMPRMPVHHVHHRDRQHDRNFGLAVDWWDRVFGTYEYSAWRTPELDARRASGPLAVKWL